MSDDMASSGDGKSAEKDIEQRQGPGVRFTPIGKHYCRFEPPDLLVICLRGPVNVHETMRISDEIKFLGRPFYVVMDVGDLDGISADVRKTASRASLDQKEKILATAILRSNWTVRTVLILLHKLVLYLDPDKATPIGFFQTEEEGRAWIDKIREKSTKK